MTHEATVGKVSADQVFYLMSRGLTENEATNLIVQGFLEVFTKELPMEYAIEFNRLVKLEMEGRSDDGGRRPLDRSPRARPRGAPPRARRTCRSPSSTARLVEAHRRRARRARLAARGPPGRAGARSRRCRSRATGSTRRTWTCAPPSLDGATPVHRDGGSPARCRGARPTGVAGLLELREDGVGRRARSTRAPRPPASAC